ncbi:MAG: alpha/beta hydrolase family protein, partial [Mucilaginibacter sp.]
RHSAALLRDWYSSQPLPSDELRLPQTIRGKGRNDKDGAVDFTQGIEYYNGLRRLNKPVVMITYKGENHGIAKLPNRKDYSVRMQEYFDFMLKDKPAPTWWAKGVSHIEMDKFIEGSTFEEN